MISAKLAILLEPAVRNSFNKKYNFFFLAESHTLCKASHLGVTSLSKSVSEERGKESHRGWNRVSETGSMRPLSDAAFFLHQFCTAFFFSRDVTKRNQVSG